MSTLSLIDRMRRWSYLQDVELWLDPMPRRRRREVLRELRDNLAAAAADSTMAEAIEELGRPRDLARAYVQADPRRRPTWTIGVLAGGGVLAICLLIIMTYMFATTDTLLATGGGTVDSRVLGISITTTATDDEISWMWRSTTWSWPTIAATGVAVLLGARVWRYWIR